MTVSSTTNKSGPYFGNGSTVEFDYEFRILDPSHVTVIMTQGGVDTTVSPSDYTVSGVGAAPGGTLTFLVAPTTGQSITIIRNAPFTQQTDLENQGAYYAETVEASLDLAVMRDQQLAEGLSRAVQIPIGADPSALTGLIEDVIRLADSADEIDTVAGIAVNVATVATNIADVNSAATNIAAIIAAPAAAQAAAGAAIIALAAQEAAEASAADAASVVETNRGLINDGSAGAPGLRFIDDTDTGVYRAGADDIRIGAGAQFGLQIAKLGTNNTTNNLGIGVAAISGSKLVLRSEDPDISSDNGITSTVQIQRYAKASGRVAANPKALRVLYDVANGAEGDCRPWSISGEMDWRNNSNPSTGEGGVAVSGVTNKYGTGSGVCFGAHFQANDLTNAATTGGLIGAEINITANGNDTNSNRYGIDLIAVTNTSTGGSAGRFTAGLRIRNGSASGKWTNGILIGGGAEEITTGINIQNSSGVGGSGILDAGTKDFGIRLTGTYTAAIALPTDAKIAMESTNAITFHYDSANTRFRLQSSGTSRVSFNISGGAPSIDILTNKVVGVRKTGWAVATGTATRTSFDTATVTLPLLAERVKALIDDLHATAGHGLIGA